MKIDTLLIITGIIFVILKAFELITWSWWIVASPFGAAILLFIIGLIITIYVASTAKNSFKKW